MDSQGPGPRQGSWPDDLSSTDELEKRLASAVVSSLDRMFNEFADGLRAHFTPERVSSIIEERLRSVPDEGGLGVQVPLDTDRMIGGDDEVPAPPQVNTTGDSAEDPETVPPAPETSPSGGAESRGSGRNRERIIAEKYRLIKKIGLGSFGSVYSAEDISDRRKVAIKFEDKHVKHPQLSFEHDVYKNFKSSVGIPQVLGFYKEQEYDVLVMDLLGKSLEDLISNPFPQRFSLHTVLILADQMISLVELVHNKGFIHRDIKPDNFLMGTGPDKYQVFLIGFGLSKRYLDNKGKHISFITGKSLTGIGTYCSINAHRGVELSRRDDLEALGYTLIYLLTGTLPWKDANGVDTTEMHNNMKQEKSSLSPDDICQELPGEFTMYLSYSRGLLFEEAPDYNFLRKIFKNLFEKKGYRHN